MNRIVLVGRLESKPEIRYTSSGIPVSNFSLSVRRSHPNSEGVWERDVFRIVTWRKLAETCCKYLEKGRMIAVDGKLQNRFINTHNNERRVMVEIHADDVRFLDHNRHQVRPEQTEKTAENAQSQPVEEDTAKLISDEATMCNDLNGDEVDYNHYLKGEEGTPLDLSDS